MADGRRFSTLRRADPSTDRTRNIQSTTEGAVSLRLCLPPSQTEAIQNMNDMPLA